MFDFEINNRGDIILEPESPISTFKLSFDVAEFPIQRISFMIPYTHGSYNFGDNKISFRIEDDPVRNTKSISIEDMDEIFQAILLKMRTEFKDTNIRKNGSMLYNTRHTTYIGKDSLDDVKRIATEIVHEHLRSADVKVEYLDEYHSNDDNYFSFQQVIIKILYDGEVVKEYVVY